MADKIHDLEKEIEKLSRNLDAKRARLLELKSEQNTSPILDKEAISRFSRQLILPEIGPKGQERILKSRVLIVGAGGLGCPCCLYLCTAGVGRVGLVDFDAVDISNIQRQIMHTESRVGLSKALSCALTSDSLNSKSNYTIHNTSINSVNAIEIISDYDIVIDCSDNVATRYLLNDACVITNRPLVSGSALRFEGQLTVYNYLDGPCYRCLYPEPPPAETVTNCSDGGVLGPITGVIGSLQALECLKIICHLSETLSQKLLLFDGLSSSFRPVKLRGKKRDCAVCGEKPTIVKLIDYEQFCGASAHDKEQKLTMLGRDERISVKDYCNSEDHVLLDVRMRVETEICKLPHEKQVNIPINEFNEWNLDKVKDKMSAIGKNSPLYVVCHRGNDSQRVVRFLKDHLGLENVKDIIGGLEAWAREIDPEFPRY